MREYIDEIFEALYGSKISCDDSSQTYAECYQYEVDNMMQDYGIFLASLRSASMRQTAENTMQFILFTEMNHIGNDGLIEKNLNKAKLLEVSSKIAKENTVIVKDLINKKDYDYIAWRGTSPDNVTGTDIFMGVCKSENGKLIPLDGDLYSDTEVVVKYEEWANDEEGIINGLTVVCETEWGMSDCNS